MGRGGSSAPRRRSTRRSKARARSRSRSRGTSARPTASGIPLVAGCTPAPGPTASGTPSMTGSTPAPRTLLQAAPLRQALHLRPTHCFMHPPCGRLYTCARPCAPCGCNTRLHSTRLCTLWWHTAWWHTCTLWWHTVHPVVTHRAPSLCTSGDTQRSSPL